MAKIQIVVLLIRVTVLAISGVLILPIPAETQSAGHGNFIPR
jgi:hypothetical protein